jgi:antitoxin YefM
MLYHHHQITLTEANQQLTQLCEQVIEDREIVIIKPTEGEEVALIPLEELYSMIKFLNLTTQLK